MTNEKTLLVYVNESCSPQSREIRAERNLGLVNTWRDLVDANENLRDSPHNDERFAEYGIVSITPHPKGLKDVVIGREATVEISMRYNNPSILERVTYDVVKELYSSELLEKLVDFELPPKNDAQGVMDALVNTEYRELMFAAALADGEITEEQLESIDEEMAETSRPCVRVYSGKVDVSAYNKKRQ